MVQIIKSFSLTNIMILRGDDQHHSLLGRKILFSSKSLFKFLEGFDPKYFLVLVRAVTIVVINLL